jgi:hypothetical protein
LEIPPPEYTALVVMEEEEDEYEDEAEINVKDTSPSPHAIPSIERDC